MLVFARIETRILYRYVCILLSFASAHRNAYYLNSECGRSSPYIQNRG